MSMKMLEWFELHPELELAYRMKAFMRYITAVTKKMLRHLHEPG